MSRTVDIITGLRNATVLGRPELQRLLLEAADRLEQFAWDGLPPRTPHLAADSSPNAGDVDAGASPPTRRVGRPAPGGNAPGGDGGGEVRLASTAMPLAAAEFSEPDPCLVHGLPRPVPRLSVVPF